MHNIYKVVQETKEVWVQAPDDLLSVNKAKEDIVSVIEAFEVTYDKLSIAIEALNFYKDYSLYSVKENNKDVLTKDASLYATLALRRIGAIE